MAQVHHFPEHRIVRRGPITTIPEVTLPGYGSSVPFDNDGRGGSLSDQWRDMCTRHGVECGIRCVSRIPMLERSTTSEMHDQSADLTFVRDLGQGRAVAVVFPRIVLFESRNRRVLFFGKGSIDRERLIAALGRQIGDVFHHS